MLGSVQSTVKFKLCILFNQEEMFRKHRGSARFKSLSPECNYEESEENEALKPVAAGGAAEPEVEIDFAKLPRPQRKVFQPAVIPVGGSSVTLKNGHFILTDGRVIAASDRAIKLRKEWELELRRMEQEVASREKNRTWGKQFKTLEVQRGKRESHFLPIPTCNLFFRT